MKIIVLKTVLVFLTLVSAFSIKAQTAAALSFDGSNDYVALTNNSSAFNISASHIKTVQFWFKNYATQGNHVRIFSTGDQSWTQGFWIGYAFGSPYLKLELSDGIGVGVTLVGTSAIRGDNLWHQATAVFNDSTARLYVDGLLEGTANISGEGSINSSGSVHIGNSYGNEALSYFRGSVDELRVWNRALGQGEIDSTLNCELTGSEPGLIAYYNFNEGIASANNAGVTNLPDLTLGSNNGSLTNFLLNGALSNWVAPGGVISCSACNFYTPAVYTTTDSICIGATASLLATGAYSYLWMPDSLTGASVNVSPLTTTTYTVYPFDCLGNAISPAATLVMVDSFICNPGACLNFDGTDDRISMTHFGRPMDMTCEAWIKTNSLSTMQIIGWGGSTGNSAEFKMNAGTVGYFEWDGSTFPGVSSTISVNDNVWHHVAVVRTSALSNNISIYVDGILSNSGTVNHNITTNALNIGAYNFSGLTQFFNGSIDEVRIWNRALSLAEIQNNMNCELSGIQSGLLRYYKFNEGLDALNNSGINILDDSSGNNSNGTLGNFTLDGPTSNWIAPGGVVNDFNCSFFVGVEDSFKVEKSKLKIFPNPNNGEFSIALNGTNNKIVEIIDGLGSVVYRTKTNVEILKVDLSSFAHGIYFIKVESNDSVSSAIVIKEGN